MGAAILRHDGTSVHFDTVELRELFYLFLSRKKQFNLLQIRLCPPPLGSASALGFPRLPTYHLSAYSGCIPCRTPSMLGTVR